MTANIEQLQARLVSAALRYDEKQAKKKGYNIYAMAQYLLRIDEVIEDIRGGGEIRAAIVAGFNGPLATALLKAVGESGWTRQDDKGGLFYVPSNEKSAP